MFSGPLTVLHHDGQEAHNDLWTRPDEDLAFPTLLSIVDAFKRIRENVHAHHDACWEKESQVTNMVWSRAPTGDAKATIKGTEANVDALPAWNRDVALTYQLKTRIVIGINNKGTGAW